MDSKEVTSVQKVKVTSSSNTPKKMRPALTPEARENQLISLAMDAAEEQIRSGTASSQVITHFLKLATTKAQLEKEKLERENRLLAAKTEAIDSQTETKELYEQALKAIRNYSGQGDPDDYSDVF